MDQGKVFYKGKVGQSAVMQMMIDSTRAVKKIPSNKAKVESFSSPDSCNVIQRLKVLLHAANRDKGEKRAKIYGIDVVVKPGDDVSRLVGKWEEMYEKRKR